MKATVEIKKLNLLSIATALKLFTIKVATIATYGLQFIWNHLMYSNLKLLEGVRTAYLKRMLWVSKYTPNRITYILANTAFFIEDLMAAHNLVPTLQSTRFLKDRRQKSRIIDQGLLNTPAMTSSEWKEANYLLRHLYMGVAAQGLHHRICATKGFHSPNERCQCTLCGGLCLTYPIIECTRRTLTLSHYANDTNFQ
jgi:hypothetical protein